jgi:hypothetical protein
MVNSLTPLLQDFELCLGYICLLGLVQYPARLLLSAQGQQLYQDFICCSFNCLTMATLLSEVFQVSQHVQPGHSSSHLVPHVEFFSHPLNTALQMYQVSCMSIKPISFPCCLAGSRLHLSALLHLGPQLLRKILISLMIVTRSLLPTSSASLPICCALS